MKERAPSDVSTRMEVTCKMSRPTSSPRAIVLTNTRMYWTGLQTGTLVSANLDGTDRRVLRVDLVLPYELAVDEVHNVIYWSDSGTNHIRRCDINGNDPQDVTAADDPVALALDPLTGILYWGDNGGKRIHAVNKDGTGAVELLTLGAPDATYGIALFAPLAGPANKDDCKNGGWRTFQVPRTFKNQGDCIQFVNTGR